VSRGRPPHPPGVVARMRRERQAPRWTQWDHLHLRQLRDLVVAAAARVGAPGHLALDLWCGVKPYDPLLAPRTVGVDIDLRFASADVVAALPLPFRDGAFDGALCTQALYLVDDPDGTVAALGRAVRPGGWVLVTVPSLFRRADPAERRYRAADLEVLFSGWQDVAVSGAGGPGSAAAYALGSLAEGAARRLRAPAAALAPLFLLTNVVAAAVDRLPWPARLTHQLCLTARRPA
jgi:SAM-dependent methyltransferase